MDITLSEQQLLTLIKALRKAVDQLWIEHIDLLENRSLAAAEQALASHTEIASLLTEMYDAL